jgi:phosphatidylserine decarboxylase
MPVAARLVRCQWIPGRYFPQNAVALQHIQAVYERNERATLFCETATRRPFLMVLVGASLVGGIHLADLPREQWVSPRPTQVDRPYDQGQRIAHFSFGSTVVLLFPRGVLSRLLVSAGAQVQMGQPIAQLREP